MFRDVNITHPDFVGTSVVPRTGAQITLAVWRIMVGDQFHKRVVAMYNLLPELHARYILWQQELTWPCCLLALMESLNQHSDQNRNTAVRDPEERALNAVD